MTKVLLVEDDSGLREILDTRLKSEGYQTLLAGNGQEGVNLAMKERPDVVIADIMMPLLSGFDMLRELKANPETKNIKTVVYTALSSDEDRAMGQSLGVDRYLVKSQNTITEDLLKAVSEVAAPAQAGPAPAVPPPPAAPAPTSTTAPTAQSPGDMIQPEQGNTNG